MTESIKQPEASDLSASAGSTRAQAIARITRRAKRQEVTEALDRLDLLRSTSHALKVALESTESAIEKTENFIKENRD